METYYQKDNTVRAVQITQANRTLMPKDSRVTVIVGSRLATLNGTESDPDYVIRHVQVQTPHGVLVGRIGDWVIFDSFSNVTIMSDRHFRYRFVDTKQP